MSNQQHTLKTVNKPTQWVQAKNNFCQNMKFDQGLLIITSNQEVVKSKKGAGAVYALDMTKPDSKMQRFLSDQPTENGYFGNYGRSVRLVITYYMAYRLS